MKIILVFFFCCLVGFAQREQKTETKQPAAEQARQEPVKKPARDLRNLAQYGFERYCNIQFYYFDHPQEMVNHKPEIFAPVAPDIAMHIVQRAMLRNLLVGGCEW